MTPRQNRHRQLLAACHKAIADWRRYGEEFDHDNFDIIYDNREKLLFNKMGRKVGAYAAQLSDRQAREYAGAARGAFLHPLGHFNFGEMLEWLTAAENFHQRAEARTNNTNQKETIL